MWLKEEIDDSEIVAWLHEPNFLQCDLPMLKGLGSEVFFQNLGCNSQTLSKDVSVTVLLTVSQFILKKVLLWMMDW